VVVNGNAGVDARILRHQVTDLQQDVTSVPGEERGEEGRRGGDGGEERDPGREGGMSLRRLLPDVDGEAAVAGHRVLVGALQGHRGFGSSTDFAAEDDSLSERTNHV